jgi:DNA-binding response OmpR family regulator
VKSRVVVIEDDAELAELLRMYLSKEGLTTTVCETAEEGLAVMRAEGADCVILDINLPGMDGFEFLQALRKADPVPVIIVSAREADEDIIMGLGIGADEFVTKPFTPRVLVARVRAILRRSREPGPRTISFGPYIIEPHGYNLLRDGVRITLSTREFDVLRFFVLHPGAVMSQEEIYKGVWGAVYGDLTAVAVYIRRLRRKIEDDPSQPRYLQTVHGRGYRFDLEGAEG